MFVTKWWWSFPIFSLPATCNERDGNNFISKMLLSLLFYCDLCQIVFFFKKSYIPRRIAKKWENIGAPIFPSWYSLPFLEKIDEKTNFLVPNFFFFRGNHQLFPHLLFLPRHSCPKRHILFSSFDLVVVPDFHRRLMGGGEEEDEKTRTIYVRKPAARILTRFFKSFA